MKILHFYCILMLFASCKTIREVQVVERVRTDTLRQVVRQSDSIYVHDSVTVSIIGDTVRIDRWHDRWRDRWRHDTTYIHRTDSVPIPVDVVREVPAQLTDSERLRLWLGTVVMWAVIAFAVIKILIYVTKKK